MFGGYVALTFIAIALLIIIPIVHYSIEYYQKRQEKILAQSEMQQIDIKVFNAWRQDLGNPG